LSRIIRGLKIKWRSRHTSFRLRHVVIGACRKLILWHWGSVQWYNILTVYISQMFQELKLGHQSRQHIDS
jgi:hypothetical protein